MGDIKSAKYVQVINQSESSLVIISKSQKYENNLLVLIDPFLGKINLEK